MSFWKLAKLKQVNWAIFAAKIITKSNITSRLNYQLTRNVGGNSPTLAVLLLQTIDVGGNFGHIEIAVGIFCHFIKTLNMVAIPCYQSGFCIKANER